MRGPALIFRGYGVSVRVDVPPHTDVEGLTRLVAPELQVQEASSLGPPDLLLTRWNGVHHLVLGEQRRYGPYRTQDTAFRGVANAIHYVAGRRSPMTFLHAGAVEIEGKAVVFPGGRRAEKSPLVARLIQQGCGYLSDEYAVISPEGAVFPFSKPIRLKNAGGRVNLEAPESVRAPGGLACSLLLHVRNEEGSIWNPEPMTTGAAVWAVLPFAVRSREAPSKVLEALTAMAHNAACFRGISSYGQPTLDDLRALEGVVEAGKRQARA